VTVDPPVASFTFTTGGPNLRVVAFQDTSTGSPVSWLWNFGHTGSGANNVSTLQNPTHDYNLGTGAPGEGPGSKVVTLTVTNAGGSSSTTQFVLVP
jgi:PKD repeat protein